MDNEDLTYITSILDSFSKPKALSKQRDELDYAISTPEGAPMRAAMKQTLLLKFKQNFNQKLTLRNSEAENFSCFTNVWEEGPTELANYYFDEEEDDSLNNEDTKCEKTTWNEFDLKDLGEISDEEDTWSEAKQDEFETQNGRSSKTGSH